MKKFLILFALMVPTLLTAQNVAINNDGSTADNTALLDIKSNSKGLLIPRMTSAERQAIAFPAIGLLVFDMTSSSFWTYRGDVNGGWAELQNNLQNYWGWDGGNLYNKNLGNVGIGTNLPSSTLTIDGANPGIGIRKNGLAHGFIQAQGSNMHIGTPFDNVAGKLVLGTRDNDHMSIDNLGQFSFMYNNVATGFLRTDANNMKLGTFPAMNGGLVFSPKNVDRVWINASGLVGIGTSNPVAELTVNGSNPYIQLQNSGANTGFFQLVNDDVRVGTNSTNTLGNLVFQTRLISRMTINENGQVGIGTTSPTSILSINSSNPIVQLKNSGVDKGFVQLVNDDIKIGTNAGNTDGRFVVRTDGSDRFSVNSIGNATLGTSVSGGLLTVDGAYTGLLMKTGGIDRLNIIAAGSNKEIHGEGIGVLRIRNNGDGIYMYSDGRISIGGGGAMAAGYTISVEGKLIATEVTSLPFGSWPDYVFENDYKLRSLAELKEFIEKNKHLPNIPPASEIEKTGVQLGDMNRRLVEKVEELTLYVLQLQQQIDELKKQIPAAKEN